MSEPLLRIDLTPVHDEIMRLRQRAERAERILAKLREPSEAVWGAVALADKLHATYDVQLQVAVEAAEREVDA